MYSQNSLVSKKDRTHSRKNATMLTTPRTTMLSSLPVQTCTSFVLDDGTKENTRPQKAGARPPLAPSGTSAPALATARAAHEASVAAAVGGSDPLAPWLAYVSWMQTAYPAGGVESGLLPALERATRSFADDIARANDPAYVRLWMTYADLLADPGDVFRYMDARGIGGKTALFYMGWAWLAEHRGDFALADRVYALGAARGAAPADRLRARAREFQRRMYRKLIAAQGSDGGVPSTSAGTSAAAPARQVTSEQLSALSTGEAAAAPPPALHDVGSENAPPRGVAGLPVRAVVAPPAVPATATAAPARRPGRVLDGGVLPGALHSQQQFPTVPAPQAAAPVSVAAGGAPRVAFAIFEDAPEAADAARGRAGCDARARHARPRRRGGASGRAGGRDVDR